MKEKDIQRFESKLRPQPNGCIHMDAGLDAAGYPMFWVEDATRRASRISFEIYKHKPARCLVIRHTCDNPACVNPKHLIEGSYAENTHDMLRRGRQKKPTRLTPEVIDLIVVYTTQGMRGYEIANRLDISASSVSTIRKTMDLSIVRNGNILGVPGVTKVRGRFRVRSGDNEHLGYTSTLKEALQLRWDSDIELEKVICWEPETLLNKLNLSNSLNTENSHG